MGSRCIPEGIVEDILLKLPTKSIIRFQIVSKSWLNLIKSSYFANKHLLIKSEESYLAMFFVVRPTPRLDRRFLLTRLYEEGKETSQLLFQDQGVNKSPVLNFELPPSYDRTYISLVGHYNGIMCLSIDFSRIILLINPFLKAVKTLPISPVSPFDNSIMCMKLVGFGFENVTMNFKVVRIFRSPQAAAIGVDGYRRAEVYNVTTNAWRELNELPFGTIHTASCSTLFNGVVHRCIEIDNLDWEMLTFNMSTEVFQLLQLPQGWNNDVDNVPTLFVMNQESLAFVSYCHVYYSDHVVNIWTMNQHGNGVTWNKLYSIGPLLELVKPLGFRKEHEFLYVIGGGTTILYDLLSHFRSPYFPSLPDLPLSVENAALLIHRPIFA